MTAIGHSDQFGGQGGKVSFRTNSVPVVVIVVTVKIVTGGRVIMVRLVVKVKFDRVESYDDKARSAFVAYDAVTLLGLSINEYVFTTFGANRCRHFSFSPKKPIVRLSVTQKPSKNGYAKQSNVIPNNLARIAGEFIAENVRHDI